MSGCAGSNRILEASELGEGSGAWLVTHLGSCAANVVTLGCLPIIMGRRVRILCVYSYYMYVLEMFYHLSAQRKPEQTYDSWVLIYASRRCWSCTTV